MLGLLEGNRRLQPLECPDCHSGLFNYVMDSGKIRSATFVYQNEESDIQSDYKIVNVQCSDCPKNFWVAETQAMEHLEVFV